MIVLKFLGRLIGVMGGALMAVVGLEIIISQFFPDAKLIFVGDSQDALNKNDTGLHPMCRKCYDLGRSDAVADAGNDARTNPLKENLQTKFPDESN